MKLTATYLILTSFFLAISLAIDGTEKDLFVKYIDLVEAEIPKIEKLTKILMAKPSALCRPLLVQFFENLNTMVKRYKTPKAIKLTSHLYLMAEYLRDMINALDKIGYNIDHVCVHFIYEFAYSHAVEFSQECLKALDEKSLDTMFDIPIFEPPKIPTLGTCNIEGIKSFNEALDAFNENEKLIDFCEDPSVFITEAITKRFAETVKQLCSEIFTLFKSVNLEGATAIQTIGNKFYEFAINANNLLMKYKKPSEDVTVLAAFKILGELRNVAKNCLSMYEVCKIKEKQVILGEKDRSCKRKHEKSLLIQVLKKKKISN